ncbi:MAG: DUF4469 domain-containing protein [Spirochaetia bacterium]|nr:DUF4469 domain-containing protein [Spirochaetia bacterium]
MNYTLIKNQLYSKESDPRFIARSRVTKRLVKDQMIQKIAYGCTLTDADVNAVLTSLEKVLVEYIALGCSIDLGFLSLGYSVKGGFDSEEDSFRKDRNWINVNASVANSFSKAVNDVAKPEKVSSLGKSPRPITFTKVSGDVSSQEYKSGNLARLSGSKLQFDQADVETGVFLKPETGNEVRISEYAKTGDTMILLKLPDQLTAGKNKLEVRSRLKDGTILSGVLETPVMIAA